MCEIDDPSDVWTETNVRARKPHRCCECRLTIPAGAKYVRFTSLFDGHWDTYLMHYECRVLWGSMAGDLCERPGFVLAGGLDEELQQYSGQPEAEPYRLRFERIKATYAAA